jgi:hypothetical protein
MKKVFVVLLITVITVLCLVYKDEMIDVLLKNKTTTELKKAESIIKQQEKEQKLKQIEEDRLRNIKQKQIVNQDLHKTQKIIVLQGSACYTNVIPKQAWIKLFNNNLNIELNFKYSITYDTSLIEVQYIDQGIAYVRLNLDKENFQQILALQSDSIKQVKDKESFAVNFNSIDLQNILKVAQEDVEKEISQDENVYLQSVEGLKEFVMNLGQKFNLEIKITE